MTACRTCLCVAPRNVHGAGRSSPLDSARMQPCVLPCRPPPGPCCSSTSPIFAVQSLTGDLLLRPFALWPPASAAVSGRAVVPGLAVADLRLPARQPHPPVLQHVRAVHVRRRNRAPARHAALSSPITWPAWSARPSRSCVVVSNIDMRPIPTVGASGGVFGLLLAFGMAYPQRRIMLMFPPIPMPAWLFVTLYGLLELYLGRHRVGPGRGAFRAPGRHGGGLRAAGALAPPGRRPR